MSSSLFEKLCQQAEEHARTSSESEATGKGVCENVVDILEQDKTPSIKPISWVYSSVFHMTGLANDNRLNTRRLYLDQMITSSITSPLYTNYDSRRADIALSYISRILVWDFSSSLAYIFDSYGEQEFIGTLCEILNGIVRLAIADIKRMKNERINGGIIDTRAIHKEIKLFLDLLDKLNNNLKSKGSYAMSVDISILQNEIDLLLEIQ